MAIQSLADYRAAGRQQLLIRKDAIAYSGQGFASEVRISGSPGAAFLSNTYTIVPANPANGFPTIYPFENGYVASIEATLLSGNAAFGKQRWLLGDLLLWSGPYTTASNATLTAPPSFASRLPGGSYSGLQIWSEGVAGSAGVGATLTVGYTNENGTSGRSTGAVDFNPAPSSNVGFQAVQFPLQAGDTGVRSINSVVGAGTNYTANLMILRPLVWGCMDIAKGGIFRKWFDRTHAVQVFADSALVLLNVCEGTPTTLVTAPLELAIELVNEGGAPSGVIWNRFDKGPDIAVTNAGLTATYTPTVAPASSAVRGTVGHAASGKYYFEIHLDLSSSGNNSPAVGVASHSWVLAPAVPGQAGSWLIQSGNGFGYNGIGGNAFIGASTTGDVLMFAVDFGAGKIWYGKNGTWFAGSPAAGTGATWSTIAGTLYPACQALGTTTGCTARFAASSWAFAAPSGFGPW